MKISLHPYFLEFNRPFSIAHGIRTGTELLFVKIEKNGITGWGEASFPPYRKETPASSTEFISKQHEEIGHLLIVDPFKNTNLFPFSKDNPAAGNAIQTAILDYYAKSKSKPVAAYFHQQVKTPALTLTVTKNDFSQLKEKLILAEDFTHLKLKLTGEEDDFDFVKAARQQTSLPFCMDANQGFKKKEDAIKLISRLENLNCVLIEQPLPDFDHEGHYWLKQRTSLPVIADESICFYEDLVQYHEAYSGVNVKLMKCGGLFHAQKMLDFAGENKLMKLIGCMSESSLGVAAASVLASQCELVDLDSPCLNKNDPFRGFSIKYQQITISEPTGIGVIPKNNLI